MLAHLFHKIVERFTQTTVIVIPGPSAKVYKTHVYRLHTSGTLEIETTTYSTGIIASGYTTFQKDHPLYSFFLWLVTQKKPGNVSTGEKLDRLYYEFKNKFPRDKS